MSVLEVELSVQQDKLTQEGIRFIRDRRLIEAGDKVLAAISGGLDSTVLACLMARMARLLQIDLELVHVDHRTRGSASEQEGLWVKVLGERLGLKTHLLRLEESKADRSQQELRQERRKKLLELARETGTHKIATAHHGDDNAETFLMRSISGTGSRGLAGIAPRREVWIRPLLFATRQDLETFARQHRLGWVEDPSNARGEYLRNRLRQEALPLLESLRGGALRNLARAAERLEEEEQEWRQWIEAQIEGSPESLSLGWLDKWPRPLQRRIFGVWLEKLGVDPQPSLIEALLRGQELVHPAGSFLRRSDMLLFSREDSFGESWTEGVPIEVNRRIQLGSSLAWSFLPGAPERLKSFDLSALFVFRDPRSTRPHAHRLAWDLLPWPLLVRATPKGAALDTRVEALLLKASIPKPYWPHWPLLVSANAARQIIGVLGLGIFQEYELKEGRCLSVECFFEERLNALSHSC